MSDGGSGSGGEGGNPLDVYRRKASFSVEELRNLLDGEELVEFRERIWATMARDPLFAPPQEELSLDQQRRLNFARVKRVIEYDFLPADELMQSPMKSSALTLSLWAFDSGLMTLYGLSRGVSGPLNIFIVECIL